MSVRKGYPVVLTADRTLVAEYQLLFDGMLAASQTTTAPPALLGPILMPRPRGAGERSPLAPLGLRRIEAALVAGGLPAEDVAVVDPDALDGAIGPATRVVAVTSGEPAGLGMNTSTMTGVAGGRIYPEAMFRRMMANVRRCILARAPAARVVLGGPGAWQLAGDVGARRALGVGHVVTGYAEGNAADVFRALLAGDEMPEVITGKPVPADNIPRIRGASTMGVVEMSRGCGLGCSFCTIARVPMIHVPAETVLADTETNLAGGRTSIAALSEDFFRYGGTGLKVNPPALLGLLARLREIQGLRLIQIDHANVVSIAGFSDEELAEAHRLLVGGNRHDYLWVNVGIETASGELLKAVGGAGKMGKTAAGDWGELCAEQVRRLCRAGFFPMLSLMVGLPGERPEDVARSIEWVRSLKDERISVFPMLYAPVDGTPPPTRKEMTRAHWELIRLCYDLNFRWVPKMYWDNQTGAGVPLPRRMLLQMLGKGQVLQWRSLFAWHSWRAAS